MCDAAFVGVKSPSAAAIAVVGIDVVDHVVADGGAGRNAQGIDAAHVAQHAPTEVMDVVELDLVVVCGAGVIAPAPADGNARIVEIGDVVVRDLVVGAVADPHAHRAAIEAAAGADDVVVDDAMPGGVRGRKGCRCPSLARCGRRRRPGRESDNAGRGNSRSRGGTKRRSRRRGPLRRFRSPRAARRRP